MRGIDCGAGGASSAASKTRYFLSLATEPLSEGCEALFFLGFSALGLRTSLLDFFWLLAMTELHSGGMPQAGVWAASAGLSND